MKPGGEWRLHREWPKESAIAVLLEEQREAIDHRLCTFVWTNCALIRQGWLCDLQTKVRDPETHPALAGHLSKFRKTMPALALLFELADQAAVVGPQIGFREVSLEHTRQAAAFCDYLEGHARRVYSCVLAPQMQSAIDLGQKIRAKKVGQNGLFSLREVYLKGWSGLNTPSLPKWPPRSFRMQVGFAPLEKDRRRKVGVHQTDSKLIRRCGNDGRTEPQKQPLSMAGLDTSVRRDFGNTRTRAYRTYKTWFCRF